MIKAPKLTAAGDLDLSEPGGSWATGIDVIRDRVLYELNIIRAGHNYGWPIVNAGRFYLGPRVSVDPHRQNMEPPVAYWVPAIAASGLAFYTGDRFPQWKNNLFVGGMRQGEVPRSGHLERFDFNEQWEELHREGMLRELQQRIRDVRQGPDGHLYLLTAENDGALLRIEPGR